MVARFAAANPFFLGFVGVLFCAIGRLLRNNGSKFIFIECPTMTSTRKRTRQTEPTDSDDQNASVVLESELVQSVGEASHGFTSKFLIYFQMQTPAVLPTDSELVLRHELAIVKAMTRAAEAEKESGILKAEKKVVKLKKRNAERDLKDLKYKFAAVTQRYARRSICAHPLLLS